MIGGDRSRVGYVWSEVGSSADAQARLAEWSRQAGRAYDAQKYATWQSTNESGQQSAEEDDVSIRNYY
jgi:hypothetical protein